MSLVAADTLTAEGNHLFQAQQFAEAASRFERATLVFPSHHQAWKGLGHALLCLGRSEEAARAFDRAIGLRPGSATALWGGAISHADLGHDLVARNYLQRALTLQPSWIEMARGVPQLAAFLGVAARAGDALRGALGPHSGRRFRHATESGRGVEVVRVADVPEPGQVTYASLGLSDHAWSEPGRPRVELVLGVAPDDAIAPQIVANVAFHVMDKDFFPGAGTIVRDVVAVLGAGSLSERLPHVYFVDPAPWALRQPLEPGPPRIEVVAAVPVSEREYQYWRRFGPRELERVFDQSGTELFDLRRDTIV
jgi:Suppressor of fused protein (SUFU)/Tetratricopeptide repeat